MTKRKQETRWWWVEGAFFDHRGIRQWAGLTNAPNEVEAHLRMRSLGKPPVSSAAIGPNTYVEFRVVSPEDARDVMEDMRIANEAAFQGTCPSCGKKPGNHSTGRWNRFPALKCSRCGHVWATASARLPREAPEKPSKGSKGKGKGSGAKKKSKKAKRRSQER